MFINSLTWVLLFGLVHGALGFVVQKLLYYGIVILQESRELKMRLGLSDCY